MTEQSENQDSTENQDAVVEGNVAQMGVGQEPESQPAYVESDVPASLNPFDPSSGTETHETAQGGNDHAGVNPSEGSIPPADEPAPAEPEMVDATPTTDESLPVPNNGTDTTEPAPEATSLSDGGSGDYEPTTEGASEPEDDLGDAGEAQLPVTAPSGGDPEPLTEGASEPSDDVPGSEA